MTTQQFPKSSNKNIQLLAETLASYLDKEGIDFVISEESLFHQEVCGHFGCLPLFLFKAQENFREIFNKEFPIVYLENKEAFFNVEPSIDEASFNETFTFTFLAHLAHHAMEKYIDIYKSNKLLMIEDKIPLDSLHEEWNQALTDNKLKIKLNLENKQNLN